MRETFLSILVFLSFSCLTGSAFAEKTGQQVYTEVCSVCHAVGLAGSPKFGNKDDWSKHTKPIKDLVYSAIHGLGAMPPKGGRPDLTNAEVKSAVIYMARAGGLKV